MFMWHRGAVSLKAAVGDCGTLASRDVDPEGVCVSGTWEGRGGGEGGRIQG